MWLNEFEHKDLELYPPLFQKKAWTSTESPYFWSEHASLVRSAFSAASVRFPGIMVEFHRCLEFYPLLAQSLVAAPTLTVRACVQVQIPFGWLVLRWWGLLLFCISVLEQCWMACKVSNVSLRFAVKSESSPNRPWWRSCCVISYLKLA